MGVCYVVIANTIAIRGAKMNGIVSSGTTVIMEFIASNNIIAVSRDSQSNTLDPVRINNRTLFPNPNTDPDVRCPVFLQWALGREIVLGFFLQKKRL